MRLLLVGGPLVVLAVGRVMFVVRRWRGVRRAVSCAEHELRGPLGALVLAVDFGLSNNGLDAHQLRAIRAEMRRAERALDDLSRAQDGLSPVMAMTEVDVAQVVRDSVNAWRPAAVASGVTLEFSGDTRIEPFVGDPVRLAQAAGNLIANAIEHGGSRVRVTAGDAPSGITVAVTDDGHGLPADILAGIPRVTRARALLQRRPGLVGHERAPRPGRGQGLGIVAGIAVAHGGRLCAVGHDGDATALPPGSTPSDVGCWSGASLVLELPSAPPS